MKQSDMVAAKYIRRKTAGYPTSLTEWDAYIKTLVGDALFSKTVSANTQAFADSLRRDGLTLADFQTIMLMLVRQCSAADVILPRGGAFDLASMAQLDPVARRGPSMSDEEISSLAAQTTPVATDEFDTLMAKLEEMED